MEKCSVIIGANWGDEGKGHVTDICSKDADLVVRFNGGAQAAHTVFRLDGENHAFRHFGSGTFNLVPTYLSKYFIVNPIAFSEEHRDFVKNFSNTPKVYVNENCIVTTIWDIYINQAIEIMRGKARHGSCGMGIFETISRSHNKTFDITVKDCLNKKRLLNKLVAIEKFYVPLRIAEYNISMDILPKFYKDALVDITNIDMMIFFIEEFLSNIIIEDDSIIKKSNNVVFEGAQGLLLDQNGVFKEVSTPSNTGMQNVEEILQSISYKGKREIYYVSRCYSTKHGNGKFPVEQDISSFINMEDKTNIPNEFQGALRLGTLDLALLSDTINKDLRFSSGKEKDIRIVFTCIDQMIGGIILKNGDEIEGDRFLGKMKKDISSKIKGLTSIYATDSPSSKSFIEAE